MQQVPSLPMSNANLNCSYSPSGEISIPVGGIQTFVASNTTDCSGAYAVIANSISGALGLLFPNGTCTQTQGAFVPAKVKRCAVGSGALKIYTNSSKTTLLQTIGIDRN